MFIRGENPIWFFNNLVGQPVDDTYYAFFLTNTLPYVPQAVFQDPAGTIPWDDPIEFQPSAGLPNNLYFDPTLVYRIEIRQGPDQTFPLIYLIENYSLSNTGGGGGGSIELTTAENIITNPQFADIEFVSPFTITTAGTYDLGPGWQLILTGIGTTTITQIADPGSSNLPGNPPYRLQFANSGWSSAILQQTFSNNGAIFENGAIAIAFSAVASGSPVTMTVLYSPSTGPSTTIWPPIGNPGTIQIGSLTAYSNALDLSNPSVNTDSNGDAFVNIQFVLPSGTISLTNIQITGQSVPLPGDYSQAQNPLFQEISYERVVDHEFHVYRDSLLRQPKENLLVGWTFGLNPWQFNPVSGVIPTVNQYTADQTIIIQQAYVASATGSNVSVARGTFSQNYGLLVTALTANNQFAVLQYIDPSTIRPYWNQVLSARVNLQLITSHASLCTIKMRLIAKAGLPGTVSQTEPIASWTAGSDPVLGAGWSYVNAENDPQYTLDGSVQDLDFEKFTLPVSSNANMTLGMLIYATQNLNQASVADAILFNRVSLVPNDFSIDASTETFDETLRKCRFYYEKSYQLSDMPATPTYNGIKQEYIQLSAVSAGNELFKRQFNLEFIETKRIVPTITFYAEDGTSANVQMDVRDGSGSFPTPDVGGSMSNPTNLAISLWTIQASTVDRIYYLPNTQTFIMGFTSMQSKIGEMVYHYTADSRMGV